jgi:hypothetical protein
MAVGTYKKGTTCYSLVERWTGTWTIKASPSVAGSSDSNLTGVSCATPSPAGTALAYLSAVDCLTAAPCVPVGLYDSPGLAPLSLAEKT